MEDEKKHIIVAYDHSGRMSPETLRELQKIGVDAMIHDIESELEIYIGDPHTKKTQDAIVEDLNNYLKYPADLYQNREARRKAMKEAKRKGRHMF